MSNLNIRNNNPGNLRAVSGIDWKGAVGESGGFTKFSRPEYGVRATALNLYASQEKHGNNTVREIITRWAPPSENDTDAYVNRVASDMGISPDAQLPNLRNTPGVAGNMIKSIAKHEGDNEGYYDDKTIGNGVLMASGKEVDPNNFKKLPSDLEDDPELDATDKDTPQTDGTDKTPDTSTVPKPKKEISGRAKVENKLTTNWMSTVDSPTYIWTLYQVNNKLFNDPNNLATNDTSSINSGSAIIVAQSGVTSHYTMDNFMMIAAVVPGQRHGGTTPGIIQFDLMEVLGFTFLERTLTAGIALKKPGNLYSQNFVLKLEFIGRNQTTSASEKYPGVFLYPVKFNQIRSKTGPEGTRYNIIAWTVIKHAQTEAVTDTDIAVKAVKTVGEFIKELETQLNKPKTKEEEQRGMLKKKFIFKFESARVTDQRLAKNYNLETQPISSTANAEKGAGHANNMENPDTRDIVLEKETNIPMWLQKTLQNSVPTWAEFVNEAKTVGLVPTINVTPTIKYATSGVEQMSPEPQEITFTISIGISEAVPDNDERKHKEDFKNEKYQTTKLKNISVIKKYNYLYSGLNTEVLDYQLDIEGLYTVATLPVGAVYHADKKEQFVPTTPTKVSSTFLEDIPVNKAADYDFVQYNEKPLGNEQQKKVETDNSETLVVNRLSQLAKREYDAYNFEINIKGDPAWVGTPGAVINSAESTDKFDYINKDASIAFINFIPDSEDLLEYQRKGPVDMISTGIYRITEISSRFSGGSFTQSLKGFKNPTINTVLVLNQLLNLGEE